MAVSLTRLDQSLRAADIPIDGVADITDAVSQPGWHTVTRSDNVVLRIDYQASATAQQISTGDNLAMAADLRSRTSRLMCSIYSDLLTLNTTQQTNAWSDLSSGTPKKYLLDTGINAAAIGALDWAVTDSGATDTALKNARLRIAAAYIQDNPTYLVNPTFDPTINVPGDQPTS